LPREKEYLRETHGDLKQNSDLEEIKVPAICWNTKFKGQNIRT
jgi:hypothetical protein